MKQLSLFLNTLSEAEDKSKQKQLKVFEVSPQQLKENPVFFKSLIKDIEGMINPKKEIRSNLNWTNFNGSYWKIKEYQGNIKVFRWRISSRQKYFLSSQLIIDKECSCLKKDCLHFRAVEYIRFLEKQEQQKIEHKQKENQTKKAEQQYKNEREKLLDQIRQRFNDAAELGMKLYKKPFFDLELEQLKIIQEKLCL